MPTYRNPETYGVWRRERARATLADLLCFFFREKISWWSCEINHRGWNPEVTSFMDFSCHPSPGWEWIIRATKKIYVFWLPIMAEDRDIYLFPHKLNGRPWVISIIIVWRDCSLCVITWDVGTGVFNGGNRSIPAWHLGTYAECNEKEQDDYRAPHLTVTSRIRS